MALVKSNQYTLMMQRMGYAHQKLDVHTDNLARADMPGAQTMDIEDFNSVMTKGLSPQDRTKGLAVTNPGHIKPKTLKTNFAIQKSRTQPDKTLNGTSISSQEQLLGVNEASAINLDSAESVRNMVGRAHLVASLFGSKG